jgi:DNA processing protein
MKLLETAEDFELESEIVVVDDNLREKIIVKLGSSPISVDEISQQIDVPISLVNEVLLELEITGKLQRQFGNKVSLAAL